MLKSIALTPPATVAGPAPPSTRKTKTSVARTAAVTSLAGSNGATTALLDNRAAAALLVARVSARLAGRRPSGDEASTLSLRATAKAKGGLLLPSVQPAAASARAAEPSPAAVRSVPTAPLAAVSAFLQDEARQLVAPMRRDCSSRDNYDRHVLLLDELLLRGDAVWGFTPTMVLAGMAEALALYHDAYQHRRGFARPADAKRGAAGPVAEPSAAQPTSAGGCGSSALPVESFLPPLVQRVTASDTARDATLPLPAGGPSTELAAVQAALKELQGTGRGTGAAGSPSLEMIYADTLNYSGTSRALAVALAAESAAASSPDGAVSPRAAAAGPGGAVEPARVLFTVPDALLALLRHCATHPLICLTAEDQRCLPEAVHALCSVAGMVLADAEEVGGVAERSSPSAAAIRLTALRAMLALLRPFGATAPAAGHPLYASSAAAFASGLLQRWRRGRATPVDGEDRASGEEDEEQGEGSGLSLHSCLYVYWQKMLDRIVAAGAGAGAGADDAGGASLRSELMDPTLEDALPAAAATAPSPSPMVELQALLRVMNELVDLLLRLAPSTAAQGQGHVGSSGATHELRHVTAAVPVYALRTLALVSSPVLGASSDACATLCVDLLYKLAESDGAGLADAVLCPSARAMRPFGPAVADAAAASAEASVPLEDLFQALLNQLNSSHRQLHRELRNDLVALLCTILRADSAACRAELGVGSVRRAPHSRGPLLPATIDALNAIVLVLFDLVCGPELGSSESGGPEDWLRLTTTVSSGMPVLTQQALQQHCAAAMRCRRLTSPSLRKDALLLKRAGWSCLQLFFSWQVARVTALAQRALHAYEGADADGEEEEEEEGGDGPLETSGVAREAAYEQLVLLDLCHMGLVDVLLMHCDTGCDCPAVTSWTREELRTLQLEAWSLLACMMSDSALLADTNGTYVCVDASQQQGEEDEGEEQQQQQPSSSRVLLSQADVLFAEAGGITILLRYLEDGPASPLDNGTAASVRGTQTAESVAGAGAGLRDEFYEHKQAALVLLAALAANSADQTPGSLGRQSPLPTSASLRRALLTAPGLMRSLIDTLNHTREVGYRYSSSSSAAPASFALSEADTGIALTCLSLLTSLGEAAAGAGGAIRETSITSPAHAAMNGGSAGSGDEAADSANDEDGASVVEAVQGRWNRSSSHAGVFITQEEFAEQDGIGCLLAWLPCMLSPQPQSAELLGRSRASTSRRAAGSAARAAPLVEGSLAHHLPLLASAVDALRVLVIGKAGSEEAFVAAGGVHALLEVVEAMALVSDAHSPFAHLTASLDRPAASTGAAGTGASSDGLDVTVVRDAACTLQDAAHRNAAAERVGATDGDWRGAPSPTRSPRRAAFHDLLGLALRMLADLLLSREEAREELARWRSSRIAKSSSCGGESSGSAASVVVSSKRLPMNAVQMLISLWAAALRPPPGEASAESEMNGGGSSSSSQEEEEAAAVSLGGLEFALRRVRAGTRESLRREFVRRLLQQRLLLRLDEREVDGESSDAQRLAEREVPLPGEAAESDGGDDVWADIPAEELVRCAVFISLPGDVGVEAPLSVEQVAARVLAHEPGVAQQMVRAMRLLATQTDEDSEAAREDFTQQLLHRAVGLGVPVHSCLAALGFDALVAPYALPVESAASPQTADGEGVDCPDADANPAEPSPDHERALLVRLALSPAERAQLAVIAALPALCVDETCLAMADIALRPSAVVEMEEGAGEAGSSSETDAVREEQPAMRPTTPDRRCLVGLLDGIRARSGELAQLLRLCSDVETAQVDQMYQRFLATRIRCGLSPSGHAAHSKANAARHAGQGRRQSHRHERTVLMRSPGSPGAMNAVASDPFPSVIVALSPMTRRKGGATGGFGGRPASPRGGILSSSSLNSSQSFVASSVPAPWKLAESVQRRMEQKQLQDAEDTLLATAAATGCDWNPDTAPDTSEREEDVVARRAQQMERAQRKQRHERSSRETELPSTTLAEAAHTLASGAHAAAMIASGMTPEAGSPAKSSRSNNATVSTGAALPATAGTTMSTTFTATGKPITSLAERRHKKLHMIRNSLRKLPGGLAVTSTTAATAVLPAEGNADSAGDPSSAPSASSKAISRSATRGATHDGSGSTNSSVTSVVEIDLGRV